MVLSFKGLPVRLLELLPVVGPEVVAVAFPFVSLKYLRLSLLQREKKDDTEQVGSRSAREPYLSCHRFEPESGGVQ